MILVQNLLQQLNGNKMNGILLILMAFIMSCGSTANIQRDYIVTNPSTPKPAVVETTVSENLNEAVKEKTSMQVEESNSTIKENPIEISPIVETEPVIEPTYNSRPVYSETPDVDMVIVELNPEIDQIQQQQQEYQYQQQETIQQDRGNRPGTSNFVDPATTQPIEYQSPQDQYNTNQPYDNYQDTYQQAVQPDYTYNSGQDYYDQLFNIAIILPFQSYDYNNMSQKDTLLQKSKDALEIYEGMVMALEQLRGIGMNINVYVFDTENSESKTQSIVSQLYSYPLDLIIGPVYNKNLKIIADFAKNTSTFMISPLSPSTTNTEGNPYYILANPSIETHCRRIFDFILLNYSAQNIISISRSTPREQELADLIENYALSSGGTANVNKVMVTGEIELETYLSPFGNNVVIVPSFNQIFVSETIRRLNILSQKYQITLFGMPNWLDMESVDIDALQNLNFHITNEFWEVDEHEDNQGFSEIYKDRFSGKPTEMAKKGFDLLVYFGRLLGTNGRMVSNGFSFAPHDGIYNKFSFQQSYKRGSYTGFDFYENKYVHILRLDEYNLFKVN